MPFMNSLVRPSQQLARLLVAAMLCLTIAGCGDDGLSPLEEQETARAQALQLWNAQGLNRYTVEARILCFCVPGLELWHELTVVSGTVTSVRLVDNTGQEIDPSEPVNASVFDSVSQLFERIARASRATDGSRVEARYDATTGMPLEVNFFAPPGVADGGSTYYYRALTPTVGL